MILFHCYIVVFVCLPDGIIPGLVGVWICIIYPLPKTDRCDLKEKVSSKIYNLFGLLLSCVDHWKNPQPATFERQLRRRFLASLPRSTVGWHVTTQYARRSHAWNTLGIIWHHLWCDVNIYFCMFCGSVLCCIITWNLQITEFARKILFHSPPFPGSQPPISSTNQSWSHLTGLSMMARYQRMTVAWTGLLTLLSSSAA